MSKQLFQFRDERCQPLRPPSLQAVCERFGFSMEEVDAQYGVLGTDDREPLFTVLVEEAACRRAAGTMPEPGSPPDPAVGGFSNPPIDTFGPPKT